MPAENPPDRIGPLYARDDYPGFFKRLTVDAVDFSSLILVLLVILLLLFSLDVPERVVDWAYSLWLLSAVVYLGPWKSTGVPTLGYLLFGLKLLDLEGKRPGFWRTMGRAAFLAMGPLNYLVDIFWIHQETLPRQALRDRFCGTYLVRKQAHPVGRGRIRFHVVHLMGTRMVGEILDPLPPTPPPR